jgi:cytochrome oxidase Cu insertion factor (SCO1/SenC/PrrC family)
MTGMGGTLGSKSPYVTARFNQTLWHQLGLLTILVLVAALVTFWVMRRDSRPVGPSHELGSRKVLRVGFGSLWIIAGLLQLQPQMPIGLPTQVVSPAAASAPGWVQHIVSFGTDAWLRHPIVAAVAVVWLQLGLGLWLLFADRGRWSQAAGWASGAYAAGIWIFGNAIGGLFIAPISWMTGAPGATLFYALAGVAIGLNPAMLRRRSLIVWTARAFGALLLYFAILQAWPGRGFWGGGTARSPGSIGAMAQVMGSASQPGLTTAIQSHLSTFSLHLSWLINLVVVVGLGFVGVAYLSARKAFVPIAARVYLVLALADWIFIQDLGIFGGVATDVNSMIPSAIVALAIWTALIQLNLEAPLDTVELAAPAPRRIATVASAVVFAVGAIPMLALSVLPGATADVAAATGPGVATVSLRAPAFSLIDQDGQAFSLRSLRGHTVVMAFLDPLCTTDCPIEAQQMRAAASQLGVSSGTEFIAIDANPLYRAPGDLQAFDAQEGFGGWAQWHYLTGTKAQLEAVWSAYGVSVVVSSDGAMVDHTEPFYVIDPSGVIRSTWSAVTGQGPGSVLGRSGTALIVAEAKAAS